MTQARSGAWWRQALNGQLKKENRKPNEAEEERLLGGFSVRDFCCLEGG
ncbi:hypothetical protein BRCON_1737 [Candidatus Sumerlaea chitinivorans]|uniref:Uncharacterized protein n=1 Tax=Sumerlaea chitinivorans TaxID=2250252 RepID=A0A2Z4Y5R5_SUMC1|nr:hypothetical protein BRCON_1737 [Candidatus Sumerlaea chitinivorans]